MAMTSTQQNVVSTVQDLATQLLVIRKTVIDASQLYTALNLAALTDADFAAIAPFANITAANFQAAAAAIASISGNLGDYSSGTSNASKLIKIVNAVPK